MRKKKIFYVGKKLSNWNPSSFLKTNTLQRQLVQWWDERKISVEATGVEKRPITPFQLLNTEEEKALEGKKAECDV